MGKSCRFLAGLSQAACGNPRFLRISTDAAFPSGQAFLRVALPTDSAEDPKSPLTCAEIRSTETTLDVCWKLGVPAAAKQNQLLDKVIAA